MLTGGEDAVDVGDCQSSIPYGVVDRFQMERQLAFVRQCADLVALVDAHNADCTSELFHRSLPPASGRYRTREVADISGLFGWLKEWNGHLVGELLKHHLYRHIALDHLGIRVDVDEVGHHMRALVKLNHGENIGRLDLIRRVKVLVRNLKGVELALAASLNPADTSGGAKRAEHARIKERLAAVLALGQHQLALLEAIPVRFGLRSDGLGDRTIRGFHTSPFCSVRSHRCYLGRHRFPQLRGTILATREYRAPGGPKGTGEGTRSISRVACTTFRAQNPD